MITRAAASGAGQTLSSPLMSLLAIQGNPGDGGDKNVNRALWPRYEIVIPDKESNIASVPLVPPAIRYLPSALAAMRDAPPSRCITTLADARSRSQMPASPDRHAYPTAARPAGPAGMATGLSGPLHSVVRDITWFVALSITTSSPVPVLTATRWRGPS